MEVIKVISEDPFIVLSAGKGSSSAQSTFKIQMPSSIKMKFSH